MALVIVIIIVAVLAIVVTQFSYSVQVDERIALNFAVDRENYYAARGALTLATVLLEKDAEEDGARDTLYDDWGEKGMLQNFTSIGEVSTNITVTDQERLININRLANKENRDYDRIYESLLRLVDILELDAYGEYAIVERIADYLDADEEGTYEEGARNGPFSTIEELLRVPGLDTRIVYGYTDLDGIRHSGLADYVCLWGTARINLNTASVVILQAISPEISLEDADNILDYRENVEPFNTPADLINVTGMADIYQRDQRLTQYLTTVSTYFELRVKAEKDTVRKDVRAVLRRQGRNIDLLFWKERDL
jgi:general secretion pathway protein K